MKLHTFFAAAFLLLSVACKTRNENHTANQKAAQPAALSETNSNATNKQPKTISQSEAKSLLEQNKDVVILDVRTPEEFNGGHLQNAVNVDFQAPDFAEQLKGFDPDKRYLVYCAAGGRSKKASEVMQQQGFKEVYNCREGYEKLKEEGIPVK